jgi:TonB family protein
VAISLRRPLSWLDIGAVLRGDSRGRNHNFGSRTLTSLGAKHFAALATLTASLLVPAHLAVTASSIPQPRSGNSSNDKQTSGSAIELLSDTRGVDFSTYIKKMYLSTWEKWKELMPPSVILGETGTNCVQFRVLKDGKVPREFVKLVISSGKKELDAASLQSIRKAAPFPELPPKYDPPYVEFRLTFYYNTSPPKR